MKIDKESLKQRKSEKEIKEKILKLLAKKREVSTNELRKEIGSNWATIKKYGDELCQSYFIEPRYKKIRDGYKLRELDDTEKKILNILIEGCEKE